MTVVKGVLRIQLADEDEWHSYHQGGVLRRGRSLLPSSWKWAATATTANASSSTDSPLQETGY